MDGADIDSESQGGVKDLKSRFEKLATTHTPALKSPQKPPPPPPPPPASVYADTLSANNIPENPYSHNHSRSPSSSHSDMADSSSLRSSSSVGDLKGTGTGAKRAPPPPPPPRGSKLLNPPSPSPTPSGSPTNSLLLRPVPVPPGQQSSTAAAASLDVDVKDDSAVLPASVSSLKIRFTTANAQTPPPVPASPKTPARPANTLLAALGDPKPAVPPRPASILGFHPTNPGAGTTTDEVSPQSSRTTSRTSSTDGDSDDSVAADAAPLRSVIPPPVPARKQAGQTNGNWNAMGGATPKSSLRSLGAHFSDSSLTSYDSDTPSHTLIQAPQVQPALPPRPVLNAPPPPPPRHHRLVATAAPASTSSLLSPSTSSSTTTSTSSSSLNVFDHTAVSSTPASASAPNLHAASLNLPPPLPARRSTIVTETPSSSPTSNTSSHTTPIGARKPLGSSRLPPPPMRVIGKGDKLPPARRVCATSSDDEDEDDGDEGAVVVTTSTTSTTGTTTATSTSTTTSKTPPIDLMPDSTSSSRRLPTIRYNDTISEAKVSVHPHASWAFRGGVMAVGHGHKVKVWDLTRSESIWREIDLRENSAGAGYGLGKDVKVTSLEFCGVVDGDGDEGAAYVAWVGTKEGTLVEVDVMNGVVRDVKHSGHLHPVTHIFRYGHAMVSMDESGKVLVFGPEGGGRLSLSYTTPRVMRTTEKQDFVKMIDGQLWTAARSDHHHHHLAHGLSVLGAAGSGALGLASSSTLSTSSTLTAMTTGTQKLPVIRIYDLFNPGVPGRSVLPTEYAGGVTSGAVLASEPGRVYVGHEEGYVSIWELLSSSSHSSPPSSPPPSSSSPSFSPPDPYRRCVEVLKISTSDILCLEGVYDRLWAGSRNGVITVYDVSVRPWVVTNCWVAHPGSPVVRMEVDVNVRERDGRLVVVSVGRDEKVRLWDGLLGVDWVDTELLKREAAFSSFRELSVLIFSWNCDSARPDSLSGEAVNSNLFREVLQGSWTTSGSTSTPPDILVFGFQEVIDLESRKMTAKNVVLGGGASSMKGKKSGKKGGIASSFSSLTGSGGNSSSTLSTNGTPSSLATSDAHDGLSDKVTGAYKRWHDYLCGAVKYAIPSGEEYTAVRSENLVGLFMCIFVRNAERGAVADVEVSTVKRGMGGRYGNKGAIVARLVVGDSSICFINCHLAAGQHAVRRRNADVVGILEEKDVFGRSGYPSAYVGGGDGSMIMDHEFVFMAGDMNYRIDHRRDAIISSIKAGDLTSLLAHDQLLREMKHNRACRLRGFNEGVLSFAPTYKYDRKSGEYDTSDKQRAPAWCDRILWKARGGGGASGCAPGQGRVRLEGYTRFEANVSDHRPIAARFGVLTKRFDAGVRARVKAEVDKRWVDEQRRRLAEVKGFYVRQGLV